MKKSFQVKSATAITARVYSIVSTPSCKGEESYPWTPLRGLEYPGLLRLTAGLINGKLFKEKKEKKMGVTGAFHILVCLTAYVSP